MDNVHPREASFHRSVGNTPLELDNAVPGVALSELSGYLTERAERRESFISRINAARNELQFIKVVL